MKAKGIKKIKKRTEKKKRGEKQLFHLSCFSHFASGIHVNWETHQKIMPSHENMNILMWPWRAFHEYM